MEALSLQRNKLVKLPRAIGSLVSCTRLSLYENALEELPEEFGGLTALQEL
jgi:Leucine-rich repeat (LRR) protein